MELPIDKSDGESRLTTAVRSRIAAFDFGSRAADGSFSPGEPSDASDPSEPVAVLLVDDNSVKRRSLAAILEPLDYVIVEAESGLEALGCVQAREFAVILLDVRMPVLNGIETAALLRRGTASKLTPIIFVTAEDDDEIMRNNGFAKGGADFLITPVKPAELIAKVSVFASLFRHTRQLSARVIEVERYADGLNLLAECAPIGIFMTDSGNRFVYTNPRWSEITGISAAEARGRLRSSVIEAQYLNRNLADIPTISTDESELCYRTEIAHPGKPPKVVLVTSRAVPDRDGGALGWVGTVADVTAQTHAEIALQEARDRANEASRMKSNFLANMSHEIRTPMNGVIGMLDALLQTDLDETQRGFAETVLTSGEALLTILNDVLDFSKVEAGKLEMDNLAFDPRRLVSDVADLMRGSVRAKKLALVVDIDSTVPEAIWGDPVRVRQVLTNLIGNACKFTADGGITIKARIADPSEGSPSAPENLMLRFEIEDTGIGIEAAKREKIFAPFVQADTSTSRKYGGTGLGLAISGQLVELMGGDYGVKSELGVGSNFWFTIETRPAPLSDVDPDKRLRPTVAVETVQVQTGSAETAAVVSGSESVTEATEATEATLATEVPVITAAGAGAEAAATGAQQGAVPRIASLLLAEDNAVNQMVAVAMLANTGYEVETVSDGAAAVEATAKRDYDAILMDCHMPEMDGYQATTAIRAREEGRRHTPIIAMTAGARNEDREMCKSAGMDGYVAKPVRRSELIAQIEMYLGQVNGIQADVPAVNGSAERPEPVLDEEIFDELRSLHGENTEGFAALVREFISSTTRAIAELRAAVSARSAPDVQRISHSIKGSSAQLGGSRLADSSCNLEQQAKTNDLSDSDTLMDQLEADFGKLEGALSGQLLSATPVGA